MNSGRKYLAPIVGKDGKSSVSSIRSRDRGATVPGPDVSKEEKERAWNMSVQELRDELALAGINASTRWIKQQLVEEYLKVQGQKKQDLSSQNALKKGKTLSSRGITSPPKRGEGRPLRSEGQHHAEQLQFLPLNSSNAKKRKRVDIEDENESHDRQLELIGKQSQTKKPKLTISELEGHRDRDQTEKSSDREISIPPQGRRVPAFLMGAKQSPQQQPANEEAPQVTQVRGSDSAARLKSPPETSQQKQQEQVIAQTDNGRPSEGLSKRPTWFNNAQRAQVPISEAQKEPTTSQAIHEGKETSFGVMKHESGSKTQNQGGQTPEEAVPSQKQIQIERQGAPKEDFDQARQRAATHSAQSAKDLVSTWRAQNHSSQHQYATTPTAPSEQRRLPKAQVVDDVTRRVAQQQQLLENEREELLKWKRTLINLQKQQVVEQITQEQMNLSQIRQHSQSSPDHSFVAAPIVASNALDSVSVPLQSDQQRIGATNEIKLPGLSSEIRQEMEPEPYSDENPLLNETPSEQYEDALGITQHQILQQQQLQVGLNNNQTFGNGSEQNQFIHQQPLVVTEVQDHFINPLRVAYAEGNEPHAPLQVDDARPHEIWPNDLDRGVSSLSRQQTPLSRGPSMQGLVRSSSNRGSIQPPAAAHRDSLIFRGTTSAPADEFMHTSRNKQSKSLLRSNDRPVHHAATPIATDNQLFSFGVNAGNAKATPFFPEQKRAAMLKQKASRGSYEGERIGSKESKRAHLPPQIVYDEPEDKLQFVQHFLVLLAFIVIITSVGISHYYLFSEQKIIFCPNGMSQTTKRMIDEAKSCSDLMRDSVGLYEDCLSYRHCLPCPSHGKCVNGELRCDSLYVRKGTQCIEDQELAQAASVILEDFQVYLQSLRAAYELNDINDYKLDFSHLRNFVDHQRELYSYNLKTEQILSKISMMINQPNRPWDIHLESKATGKKIDSISTSNELDARFYSERPLYTVGQRVRKFISDYLLLLIICFLGTIYFGLKLYGFVKGRKQSKTIKSFYRTIKTDLREKVGTISGLTQTDILRSYLKLGYENDGLKRNEETFFKVVWPKLEEERRRDRVVKQFERMQFGREVPVWTLN